MLALMFTAAACAAKPKPPVDPDQPDESAGPAEGSSTAQTVAATTPEPTPASMCGRMRELAAMGCAEHDITDEECVENYRNSFETRGPEARQAIIAFGRCIQDNESCEAVTTCANNLTQTAEGTRSCTDDPKDERFMGKPVGLAPDEYAARKGAGVTRFSQHDSTKDAPIEACGVHGQLEWLLRATCDDGRPLFRSLEHAHTARDRNVGNGGRCNSIIDLYEIACEEGTYSIYLDAYVCPAAATP